MSPTIEVGHTIDLSASVDTNTLEKVVVPYGFGPYKVIKVYGKEIEIETPQGTVRVPSSCAQRA